MNNTPYKDVIIPLLKEAAALARPHFGQVVSEHKDNTGLNLVTELDKKVEQFLAEKLKEQYPNIDFYGEEFGGNKEAERFWLVDPIDGTAHFVRGNPYCTTMIALVEEGQVIFSAIYNFVSDEMFVAQRGQGATKNGQPISVSTRPLKGAYIGFEIKIEKPKGAKRFLALHDQAMIFKTVSAGYEYGLVAEGKLDGRICHDPYGFEYDYAPGALLVEEAGGVVKNIGEDSYDFRNLDFIAANPSVFTELRQLGMV